MSAPVRPVPDMPWEPYTGAGDAEDRRWRQWAERCAARLGGAATVAGVEAFAWELYCDGIQPARAAARIAATIARSRRADDETAHYRAS